MDDNINETISRNINNILENFAEMGIYNYNSKDVDKIMENMHTISYIIFKIISILRQPNLSTEDKRVYLTNIKMNNTNLLNSDTIDIILENEEHYKNTFNIFNKFNKTLIYKQNGGGDGNIDDKDDAVFKNVPIINKIPDEMLFPLDAIEDTIPITKLIFGWMLFLSTLIGSFSKIAAPFVENIMKFGTDMFWTILGAIPLFGFDPLVSALSVPMKYGFNIFIAFIIGLIKVSPNLYKFIIQLSRKNFGEAIEEFSKTTVIFTQLYNLLDKALPLLNNNLMFLIEYMPLIIKYAEPFAGIFLKTIASMNNALTNIIEQ